MRTNTLLTYLLYALITGLIGVVGYKACQMKQQRDRTAQENAEFNKTLRDLGYVEEDSTGSQYAGDHSTGSEPAATPAPSSTAPSGNSANTVSKNGIEDEDPVPATKPLRETKPAPRQAAPKSSAPASGTTTTASKKESIRNLDTDNSDGRFRVVAGTFSKIDGARREMERVIKMGYHDAEVGRYNHGKFAVVIVKRTNSLSEANKIMAQLKGKGVDVRIIDRNRKK